MSTVRTREKIQEIETELKALKRFLVGKVDFSIDENNWRKISGTVKKIRKTNFRASYGAK